MFNKEITKITINSNTIFQSIVMFVLISPIIFKISGIVNAQLILAMGILLIISYIATSKGFIKILPTYFATGSFVISTLLLGGL